MNTMVRKEVEFGGKILRLESGHLAPQTNQAVLAQLGETVVLVTVVAVPSSESSEFFPLRVDYEEKLYAGGHIREARFVKHEGPPSERAIVTARLIDHSIRPLFPGDYMDEVQLTITVLSVDEENDPRILSFIAASAALTASDMPFNGPIASLRVGLKDGEFVLNPSMKDFENLRMEAFVSQIGGKVLAIEAHAHEVPEEKILEAIEWAAPHFDKLEAFINEFARSVGKEKSPYKSFKLAPKLLEDVSRFALSKLSATLLRSPDKTEFAAAYESLLNEIFVQFEGVYAKADMVRALDELQKKEIQRLALEKGKRLDGRGFEELRPLEGTVGVLPRTHGSAFFSRGLTQALSIVTLGSTSFEQLIQSMTGEETKRYMHHYYGRPFSLGEAGPIRAPGRREVGHGALAEKALLPVVPSRESFPYTIRVATEILSQNGSTSMAATCGSSLALMDAGVPIKSPVAGVSVGLMTDESGSGGSPRYQLLADITGGEDQNGFMDFKMAGTEAGFTAVQMELKLAGVTLDVLRDAVGLSRKKRSEILAFMQKVLDKPRGELSPFAPRITIVKIDPKFIGEVIGPGGKVIKNIIAQTGCEIDIEEDGAVLISAAPGADAQKAKEMVEAITREVKAGEIYEGEVKRIMDFGAFVEIWPGKEGMVHISELSHDRVNRVEDAVSVGSKVRVKVIEIDSQGRVNLSMKALQPPPAYQPREARPATGYRTPYYQKPSYRRR